MKINISLSSASLQKLKLEVIHLFTSENIKCDRHNEYQIIVHATMKQVSDILQKDEWSFDDSYDEWSKPKCDYTLTATAGGSAVRIEFIYNGD